MQISYILIYENAFENVCKKEVLMITMRGLIQYTDVILPV